MPMEIDSPPQMHEPHHHAARPKGILKNPSFSGASGSPTKEDPPSTSLNAQDAKEVTIQNTLQNAGHRRSSSAARRSSASRRQSSHTGANNTSDEDPDRMRLKWDEANLYLAEQEAGGRMKITEPKTPFEYGNNAMEEEEEDEDVSIDPRYVNVDEMEMSKKNNSMGKKARESDIPGLELGEPEDENAGADLENDRIVRQASLSRDNSKDKHVNVHDQNEQPGMPNDEDQTKHKLFEEQRKKHYEMHNVKDMLGHPETSDDEDDEDGVRPPLPNRGINGGP